MGELDVGRGLEAGFEGNESNFFFLKIVKLLISFGHRLNDAIFNSEFHLEASA